ncbi:MAG: restriction endonuclease subunit S [Defluviitaleaceae bacterium]|nr:restriction endonuclease subunit S [Defluviitaleaceae bacterium]
MINTPEIRFKGFTDAWEQRKLGEIITEKISNGIMNRPGRNEQNTKHINVVNLYSPSHIHVDELEYFNATKKDIEKCNVEIGDIFLTRSSLKVEGIAQANILLEHGIFVFDDHIMRMKLSKDFEPFFVKESLNHSSTKREFMIRSKTGTMTTIGQEDINSSTFSFPAKPEQIAIGTFFRTLDSTITLYKRKLMGLRELKKAYLQQIFPQVGETVPKMRFEGFSEPWERQKLEFYFEERSERSGNGELISVTINSGVVKAKELNRQIISSEDKSNYKVVKIGDIAYNSMRMWQGASGYSPYNGILSPAYTVITPKTNAHSFYFAYLFKRPDMIQAFQRNSQGLTSDTWNLKFPSFSQIEVCAPSIKEQKAISDFIKVFDKSIETLSHKIGKLHQLKLTYLEKMLI